MLCRNGSARRSSKRRYAEEPFRPSAWRMPWIQTPQTFFAEVGKRRQTAEAGRDLWSYLDARDAAAAFVAAVERPTEAHLRLFLSADDTFMDVDTEPLARRVYPHALITRPMPGCAAVIDTTAARDALGFRPRHSWRDYPALGRPRLMTRFAGKTVLVTGGAGAIGSAAVRRFVSEGARVAIVDQAGERALALAAEDRRRVDRRAGRHIG